LKSHILDRFTAAWPESWKQHLRETYTEEELRDWLGQVCTSLYQAGLEDAVDRVKAGGMRMLNSHEAADLILKGVVPRETLN
jgi:hypothetical protein